VIDDLAWQPRRGNPEEAFAAADLWLLSRRAAIPQIPPPVHSDQEVRTWFQDVVFSSFEVWVIEISGDLAALMVIGEGWIDQLYVHPRWSRQGMGSRLVQLAQRQQGRLDLWTFQSNTGARRFYERHGFVVVAVTDGDNEEGEPDVRYHWHR